MSTTTVALAERSDAVKAFKTLRGSHPEERRVGRLLRAGLVLALEPCTQPLLIGAPGLGKTDLADRLVDAFVAANGRNKPAYVQVPPGDKKGDDYDMRPVCRHILKELGRPGPLIGGVGPPPWENERSVQTLIDTAQDELALREPGVLTLDEIERLVPKGRADQQPLDTIAWWADEAKVPILGIGNYDAVLTLTAPSKLDRRQPVIHYEPYEGRDGYRGYLEGMLPLVEHLEVSGLAASTIDWDEVCLCLYAASYGRVGESRRVLDMALVLADDQPLTRDDIADATGARLSDRIQGRFLEELSAGRARLAGVGPLPAEEPAKTREPAGKAHRIGRKPTIIPTALARRA